MKKLMCLVLALVMVLGLAACGGSDAKKDNEVYTVTLQYSFPESNAGRLDAVLAEMEEASNGRLKFEVYYSNSMFSNDAVVDALQDGTLNIAGMMPAEYSIFTLNGRVAGIPLMGFESYEASNDIFLNVIYNNEAAMAEYTDNGLVLWAASMCPGYQIYLGKDISGTDPSVFNGMTMMTENAEMQQFIRENGGAAMAAFPPDFYANLSNGVADGMVQHLNCITAFGCVELLETALYFGDGGFYNYPIVYCMGQDFYDSLPEDLQKLFADYSVAFSAESFNNDKDQFDGNLENMQAAGVNLIKMNDDEIAAWQTAFQPIVEATLNDLNGANDAAEEVYQQFMDTIANYDAATFQVGKNNFGVEYSR